MRRLADDELVANLLLLHGLHPDDVETRVQGALDRVRPYLGSHAGGVEFLGVDEDGVAQLQLKGSCDGCAGSAATVHNAVERAVLDAAPEVVRVHVEGVVEPKPAHPGCCRSACVARTGWSRRSARDADRGPVRRPSPGHAAARAAAPRRGVRDVRRAGPGQHSHVASLSERRLLCTCRACYLLFTAQGAGARRLRAIPERVVRVADFEFSQAQWDDLAIPVDLVFVFQQSDLTDPDAAQRIVACYPSPAGATESELDLSAWTAIARANPTIAGTEADVEAVLVRRRGEDGFSCYVVPIDVCYELVGLVRQFWTGFQGGAEVWQHIDDFFDRLPRGPVVKGG